MGKRKHDYDYVKKYFEDHSCKLLETEYIHCHTKMRYICECGKESIITLSSFRSGKRCKECGIKKISEAKKGKIRRKLTIDDAKKTFTNAGCILLEKAYTNISTPMKYICKCGEESKKSLSCFEKDYKCHKCNKKSLYDKRKFTLEAAKEIFEKAGCKLLATKYENSKVRMPFLCECMNTGEVSLHQFQKGSRCKKCEMKKKRGENHHNWNPDLTDEQRNEKRFRKPENRIWRTKVFERDNYICQICFSTNCNRLEAHHLDGWNKFAQKRFCVENGITLCKEDHKEFHSKYGRGNNTKKQFEEYRQSFHNKIRRSA